MIARQDHALPPLNDRGPASAGRGTHLFLWTFSIMMVVTAGTAFIIKLIEFFHTATHEGSSAMASFLIPLLNYLIVASGFACLFLWAFFSGQFRDVEAPKYRMLQMQREIDEKERSRTT
jgi:nitrogen fixation-related uncharacterized protein